jgi:hypothetical protein
MTTASGISRRITEHLFFSCIALLLTGYMLIGFWRRYISAGFVLAPLPSWLVHVHAFLFVGWIALFSVQIGLIASNHVVSHRRLGALMGWWAAAMAVIGPATVVMGVRRPNSGLGPSELAGDLAQTIAFVVLVSAGLAQRRNAPEHKRLMTLATAAIIGPALARWPFDFIQNGPPIALVLFYLLQPTLLVGYDLLTLRSVNRATWFGLCMMLFVLMSFLILPSSKGWLSFTSWVVHY